MAHSNARVKRALAEALESVREGLAPIVSKHLAAALGQNWRHRVLMRYLHRRPKYDASPNDVTDDVGVLLTVVLQEWDVLGRHLHGCRHWIDMLRVLRNVWAHASDLDEAVAALGCTAAYELARRAGLPNVARVKASRDAILTAASHWRIPVPA